MGTDRGYLVVKQGKREKLKLKHAGVKSDIRKNFLNVQSHHEFSKDRFFSLEFVPSPVPASQDKTAMICYPVKG